MSARVLNPVMLCDLYKLPPSVGKCNLTSGKLHKIKKDLFGKINRIECQRLFDENIEKQQDIATEKWGFDFQNGYPLSGHTQYIWEKLQTTEFIPQVYTLSRAAHIREVPTYEISQADRLLDERAARQNASPSINSYPSDAVEDLVTLDVPVIVRPLATATRPSTGKRQTNITDYMKERKRLAPTPKNLSPAKRMRKLFTVIDGKTPQSKQMS